MAVRTSLNKEERNEARRIIKEKTGYYLKSIITLNQIFRRSSSAAETGENSNEIFEFIGDRVLSLYVVKIVAQRCGAKSLTRGYSFRIEENEFTHIQQSLVNNETLATIIDDWGIAKYLILGKSDIKNDVAKETKVRADLFEAIIGAIAVESDWNAEVLETAVRLSLDIDKKIGEMIENDSYSREVNLDNAVTVLKELTESGQCTMPEYTFSGPDAAGYDADGNPKWICTCRIINDRTGIVRQVEAGSKKEAKKAAAYLALCGHLDIQNKYGSNGSWIFWIYKDGRLNPNSSVMVKEK